LNRNREQKVRYEEMLPHQVVRARRERSVAFLPVGGIEWHGQHNCLGLDTVKIHALAIECAQAGGGLVFPPLFYGEPRQHYLMETNHDPSGKIKEKMKISEESLQPGYMDETQSEADFNYVKFLLRTMRELKSLEFKVVVLMAGHYPLLHHARAAVELFNLQERGEARGWAATGYELVQEELPQAGDHAAAWETSLMMYLRPELVDMDRLPEDLEEELIGVMGQDPREHASTEYGKKGTELIVEKINGKIEELLREVVG